jgi:hypothetical protein
VRTVAVICLAAMALSTSGCCSIAQVMCGFEPARAPVKGNRATPEAAVDYLVDAFRNRQRAELYESFSAEFKRENGDFSLSEFSVAYDKAEAEFVADAESLADAERHWQEPRGDVVVVELSNPATGAFFPIAFVNRPRLRVVTDDPFLQEISAPATRGLVLKLADGRVTIDLTKLEGAQKETFQGLTEKNIQSLEFSDDWQVRGIDTARARNIRFLDKIKEYAGK